jgi:signal transduction histidine kinase
MDATVLTEVSRLWQKVSTFLSKPSASVPLDEHRNARLTAWLTFTLAFVTTLSLAFSLASAQIIGAITFVAAYIFSRTRHYKIAVYIIVIGFGAVPYMSIASRPQTPDINQISASMMWVVVPLIISSLLLSVRTNRIIIGLFALGLLLMPLYSPRIQFYAVLQSIAYLALTGGLLLVFLSHRNALEKDRQQELRQANDALRISEATLEQRVIERTKQLEAAREQAERSDQVKSAFLASMSHELRTPLNAVINFTTFVIDGDTGPINEEQSELLTEVVMSARHLLNLINDVLDMSKIETGSLKLFVEDNISVNAIVATVTSTARSLVGGKPIRIQADTDSDLPLIAGDRQRILQILLNIMSNACKFTDEGEIVVRAKQVNDEIVVSVADTGPGIAPEDTALVFEPFKQTKSGLQSAGGTGLGMPIAKSLAEAHGGRLWLESVPGKGSTFYVALPLKSDELVPALQ